jgi:hypothetical protein
MSDRGYIGTANESNGLFMIDRQKSFVNVRSEMENSPDDWHIAGMVKLHDGKIDTGKIKSYNMILVKNDIDISGKSPSVLIFPAVTDEYIPMIPAVKDAYDAATSKFIISNPGNCKSYIIMETPKAPNCKIDMFVGITAKSCRTSIDFGVRIKDSDPLTLSVTSDINEYVKCAQKWDASHIKLQLIEIHTCSVTTSARLLRSIVASFPKSEQENPAIATALLNVEI